MNKLQLREGGSIMKKISIAILDSGVKREHEAFINQTVSGFSLIIENGVVKEDSDFNDILGHGTAIYYLVNKEIPKSFCSITNIKINTNNNSVDYDDFCLYLEYIENNYSFDIINISMGITRIGSTYRMQRICSKLYKKGTLIVSAYDNNGAVSFPAALKDVVGVDGNDTIPTSQIRYNQKGIINAEGRLSNLRVPWTTPKYNIVKGTSFLCAKVTGELALKKCNEEIINIPTEEKDIVDILCGLPFKISKAAVFPFNKEIHSLARYENLLDFKIVSYYSLRETGCIGKRISEITNIPNEKIIDNISNINWDSFDTLILEHCKAIDSSANSCHFEDLYEKAKKFNKNIYCFDLPKDVLQESNSQGYCPKLYNKDILYNKGKLFMTNKPTVCIVGTSSSQGKFTLQLKIREKLLGIGYKVGQIGTEPSSLLFGMDAVFPLGYMSTVDIYWDNIFSVTNKLIWNITNKDVDIIIGGTQAGLLPYNNRNANNIPIKHRIFLEAFSPDTIILCVNPYDDLKFVNKTIKAAEGLTGAHILGAVCYPITYESDWKGNFGKTRRITQQEFALIKEQYIKEFDLELFLLDIDTDINRLINKIIIFYHQSS